MGPGQETRRGMNCLERPYRRPAPEPRAVCAPRRPGVGGEGRVRRESTSAHTRKGHRTEPAEHTDHMEWRTGRRREGTPGRENPQHAPQGPGGKGGARTSTGPDPLDLLRAPRTHDQGTAPAKGVVAHSARHQPRG